MQEPIIRKITLGFIYVHILHHAAKAPIYGTWMSEEIKKHGYDISDGTLFPILHNMEKNGLLVSEKILVKGRIRKYYSITEAGLNTLQILKAKIKELQSEIE